MARKFIVIKPRPCCGYSDGIGRVFESKGFRKVATIKCNHCKKEYIVNEDVISHRGHGLKSNPVIEESRIIWLPDDSDILEFDKQNEIERIV